MRTSGILACVCALVSLGAMSLADVVAGGRDGVQTAEERRAAVLARTGGPITTPDDGPWIAVVCVADGIPDEALGDAVGYLRKALRVSVREVFADGDPVAAADEELARGAAIAVAVASGASGASLTVFPSGRCGILDIAPLATDDPGLFALRFRKEFLRCVGYVLGVGNSAGRCVMKPVGGIADLDALDMRAFGPESLAAAMRATRERGMKPVRTVTYRRAVEEGWAPPPTNDIQRAVWDEEKAGANDNDAPAAK